MSELELLGRAVVFVPSPNVAEDHQTKNARALADREAAVLVADGAAEREAMACALELLADDRRRELLAANILRLGRPEAAAEVARTVIRIANEYGKR